jgi:SAM-dependent methyltransferase
VWLEAITAQGGTRLPVEIPEHLRTDPEKAWDDTDHPWVRFVLAIRALPKATVVEVGARAVGSMTAGVDTNPFGPHVAKLSTDIHPGAGVDVVADAHALSHAIEPGSIDGLFSVSVLEHLAAPWLAAAEINRVLKPGGLTLHLTHHTWPLHEEPNDFWRFSDRGLVQLFGPATGFEVMEAGMRGKMRVHPSPEMRRFGWHDMPTVPGWGEAYILARKVAEAPQGAFAWPQSAERIEALSRLYPTGN